MFLARTHKAPAVVDPFPSRGIGKRLGRCARGSEWLDDGRAGTRVSHGAWGWVECASAPKPPHPERLAEMDTGDRGIPFPAGLMRESRPAVVCGCNRHQTTVSPAVLTLRLGTRWSSTLPHGSHKQGDGPGCTVLDGWMDVTPAPATPLALDQLPHDLTALVFFPWDQNAGSHCSSLISSTFASATVAFVSALQSASVQYCPCAADSGLL